MGKEEKIKISILTRDKCGWVEEYVYFGEEEIVKVLNALNKLKLEIED